MKTRYLLLLFLLQFTFVSTSFTQKKSASNAFLIKKYHVFKNEDVSLNQANFFDRMSRTLGLSSETSMTLHKKVEGKNGYVHYRYKQFVNGIPVFGNTYILHEKDGQLLSATGQFTPNLTYDRNERISAIQAEKLAREKIESVKYKDNAKEPKLCFIDPAFPKVSEQMKLAYEVVVHSLEPYDIQRVFVDATSGEVISQFPILLQHGVPSTAKTKYYGFQQIVTDSIAPDYFELRDPTRGDGIHVSHIDGFQFTNDSSNWDLTNDDMDEVALDAHYCTQEYYDMMLADFDWEGLDGEGGALLVEVHLDAVNAFWNGTNSSYGDGNCVYGPLTTLEVVGHEFTHGMIDYTSNLIYAGESGAMNESMADIMGKTLEYHVDPVNFSWDLGHSFILDPAQADPFRVMDDPASVDMPDMYGGSLWFDNAGVHTNSAIGNLWFTMLSDGRVGTNEAGIDYNVPALGIEKASQIAFLTNKNYLTDNSTYNDFYLFSLLATEELYGAGAMEIAAVEEAWKAVGLPAGAAGLPQFDLSIAEPFFVNTLCTIGEYVPYTVNISNLGLDPYIPSMGAVLTFDIPGGNDYQTTITDTILPGEVLELTIDDWLIINDPFGFNVNMQLDINDAVPENNSAFRFYQVSEHPENNIGLFGSLQRQGCFSSVVTANFFIENISCTVFPSGTEVKFMLMDNSGNTIWEQLYTVPNDIQPFNSGRAIFDIDLDGYTDLISYQAILEFADDPDLTNNTQVVEPPFVNAIDDNYENPFDLSPYDDEFLDYESAINPPNVIYDGENYIGSTGLSPLIEFFTFCPEYKDNFGSGVNFRGVNAAFNACLDFSAFANPQVSFDMIQFVNDTSAFYNDPTSCILKVEWEGNESGVEYIFGQTEGELYHHDINLPPYFQGLIDFQLFTAIGNFSITQSSYAEHDVILMDNLEFRTNYNSDGEVYNGEQIYMVPTPSYGWVYINSPEIINRAELRSIDGKILKTWELKQTEFNLEFSEFKNGMYILRLQNDKGDWAMKKIINTGN